MSSRITASPVRPTCRASSAPASRPATRLGVITPSSNTVLEPFIQAMLAPLFPEVSVHFQRFRVTRIDPGEASLRQFDFANILAAAQLLVDAQVDVIAWCGTSAAWLGIEHDRALLAAIASEAKVPATTSVLALEEALASHSVTRLGLVTPYLGAIQQRIIANYAARRIAIVAERHLEDPGNFSFAGHSEATIAELIRAVALSGPQAIAVLCTNLRGARIALVLEAELGIPIFDSVSVTVWKSLALAGLDPCRIIGWGHLFGRSAPPSSTGN